MFSIKYVVLEVKLKVQRKIWHNILYIDRQPYNLMEVFDKVLGEFLVFFACIKCKGICLMNGLILQSNICI